MIPWHIPNINALYIWVWSPSCSPSTGYWRTQGIISWKWVPPLGSCALKMGVFQHSKDKLIFFLFKWNTAGDMGQYDGRSDSTVTSLCGRRGLKARYPGLRDQNNSSWKWHKFCFVMVTGLLVGYPYQMWRSKSVTTVLWIALYIKGFHITSVNMRIVFRISSKDRFLQELGFSDSALLEWHVNLLSWHREGFCSLSLLGDILVRGTASCLRHTAATGSSMSDQPIGKEQFRVLLHFCMDS